MPGVPASTRKAEITLSPFFRVGFGEDEVQVRYPGNRGKGLFSAEDVGISVPFGPRLEGGHIRARVGLGEGKAPQDFSPGHPGKILFLLLLISFKGDPKRGQPQFGKEEVRQVGDLGQLFPHDADAHRLGPHSAVFFGNIQTGKPLVPQGLYDLERDFPGLFLFPQLPGQGAKLFLGQPFHLLPQHVFFLGKFEIHRILPIHAMRARFYKSFSSKRPQVASRESASRKKKIRSRSLGIASSAFFPSRLATCALRLFIL